MVISDMKKLSILVTAVLTVITVVCLAAPSVNAYVTTRYNNLTPEQRSMGLKILIVFFVAALVIIVPMIIFLTIKKHRNREKHIDPIKLQKLQKQPDPREMISLPMSDLVPRNYSEIIGAQIRQHDPDFSSVKFCDWSKNVFIRLLTSLSENNLWEMRLLATDQLQEILGTELGNMLSQGNVNVFQNITISRSYLHLLRQNSRYEYLTVYFYGTMQSYMANSTTREPLPKYCTDNQPFKYLVTFSRSIMASTVYVDGIQAVCCRSCGAPTEKPSDVRCRYCGSPLTANDNNWLLSELKMMKDNQPLDDRGTVIE